MLDFGGLMLIFWSITLFFFCDNPSNVVVWKIHTHSNGSRILYGFNTFCFFSGQRRGWKAHWIFFRTNPAPFEWYHTVWSADRYLQSQCVSIRDYPGEKRVLSTFTVAYYACYTAVDKSIPVQSQPGCRFQFWAHDKLRSTHSDQKKNWWRTLLARWPSSELCTSLPCLISLLCWC